MYFKESDQIASKEQFARSAVEKIDRFLARKASSQFRLQDVTDFTDVHENVDEILDSYVNFRVLKPKLRFYCPAHPNRARPLAVSSRLSRKGYCQKCDKSYLLKGLVKETIYQRNKLPPKWSDSDMQTEAGPIGASARPSLRERTAATIKLHAVDIAKGIIVGVSVTVFSGLILAQLLSSANGTPSLTTSVTATLSTNLPHPTQSNVVTAVATSLDTESEVTSTISDPRS